MFNGFNLKARLTGHVGGVNCIAFESRGETMASGGKTSPTTSQYTLMFCVGDDESVRIWNLKDQTCSQVLRDHAKRWGPITALCWISDGIVIGTGRGQLLVFQRTTPKVFKETLSQTMFTASVEAIAHDAENNRIAVTSHDGHVRVLECA